MDTAYIKNKFFINEDPHIIVAAVLKCNRFTNITRSRIIKFSFHRHTEMMIVTISVIVRIFSCFVILIKREKTYLKPRILFLRILNRLFIFIKFDVVNIIFFMMIIIYDIKGFLIYIKVFCCIIVVCIVFITVVNKMIYAFFRSYFL